MFLFIPFVTANVTFKNQFTHTEEKTDFIINFSFICSQSVTYANALCPDGSG